LNFSDHDFYLSAYRYVCKKDEEVVHSQDHPNLSEARVSIPQNRCSENETSKGAAAAAAAAKKKRLDSADIAKFCLNNEIKTYDDLLVCAQKRRESGQNDVADYVFGRTEKVIRETIPKAWQLSNAPAKRRESQQTRMDMLTNAIEGMYTCEGQWLQCTTEVLDLSGIDKGIFTAAVHEALALGRGKYRNVLLVGPANCAKTFLLKPLKQLFENPINDKFAWVGADKARYSTERFQVAKGVYSVA